jgi:hypothetical protein
MLKLVSEMQEKMRIQILKIRKKELKTFVKVPEEEVQNLTNNVYP